MTADASSTPDEALVAVAEERRTLGIPHHAVKQFILYGLNGAFTAVVYTIVFWSLRSISHRTFVLDVVIAYAVGGVCNYAGARRLFKPTTPMRGHLARYLTVIAGAFALTSVLAWSLNHAGAPDIVSAYVPVMVTALPTFVLMRRWVFSPPASAG